MPQRIKSSSQVPTKTASFALVSMGRSAKQRSKKGSRRVAKSVTLDTQLKRAGLSEVGFAHLPQSLVDRGPAVALAYTYLGDAVWEVYARQHMILRKAESAARASSRGVALRPMEATKLGWCSSVAMQGHLTRLIEGDVLTEEELSVLRWGRDFGHENRSGHGSEAHREASALEALVAYWYLFDVDRLHDVLGVLGMTMCGRPLRDLRRDAVRDAAANAMDALQTGDVQSSFDITRLRMDKGAEVEEESKSHEIAASVKENHADMRESASMNVLMENDRLRARVEELEAELTLCNRARRLLRGKK